MAGEDTRKVFILNGGIVAQAATSNRNAAQILAFPPSPQQFQFNNEAAFSFLTALQNIDANNATAAVLSCKADTLGQYRLLTSDLGASALATPASPAAVSVGVASGALVAASTTRRHLVIVNTSGAYVSLGFGANAVLYSGITLNPNGGSYEMSEAQGNLYLGAINAIASAAASNVGVQQDA